MRTREELWERFLEILGDVCNEPSPASVMSAQEADRVALHRLVAEERRAVWEEAAGMADAECNRWHEGAALEPCAEQACVNLADALRARAREEKP